MANVRQPGGTITTFDLTPASINLEGAITGIAPGVHGFIHRANSAITIFDVPGGSVFTEPSGISLFGVITGSWLDSNNVNHGFVRYPNGAFSKFDAPRSGTVPQSGQGTAPQAINFWGEIVGKSKTPMASCTASSDCHDDCARRISVPVEAKGYLSVIREGDDWKIRMLAFNPAPAPAAMPSTTTTPTSQ